MSTSTIIVSLYLDGIDDEYCIEYKGIHINYKNKFYIVTVYHGLPIKYVKINNINISDFIISKWNDLLIIPLSFVHENIFTFKHYIKKELDINEKCISNNNKLKFIQNTFKPIHEIPGNPVIMYNVFKTNSSDDLVCGESVYNNTNGLYGIVIQNINNIVLVIPSIYILMTLDKQSNNIYVLDEKIELINKINNYKTICDKIYCNIHKTYIPINCYVLFHFDINKIFTINIRKIDRIARIVEFKNPSIILSNSIIKISGTQNNILRLSTGLMHLLKVTNEIEILSRIMNSNNSNIIVYKNYKIVNS